MIVQPESILKDFELSKKAYDKAGDVMLTATRVTLSSAIKYDFFVVSVLDPQSGVKVSFIRYIKDIRRFIHNDISIYDYFERGLVKAELVPPTPVGDQPDFQLQEIKLFWRFLPALQTYLMDFVLSSIFPCLLSLHHPAFEYPQIPVQSYKRRFYPYQKLLQRTARMNLLRL